jgi:hypothetical protein
MQYELPQASRRVEEQHHQPRRSLEGREEHRSGGEGEQVWVQEERVRVEGCWWLVVAVVGDSGGGGGRRYCLLVYSPLFSFACFFRYHAPVLCLSRSLPFVQ